MVSEGAAVLFLLHKGKNSDMPVTQISQKLEIHRGNKRNTFWMTTGSKEDLVYEEQIKNALGP